MAAAGRRRAAAVDQANDEQDRRPKCQPLEGTQVVGTVATGGGGGVFQTRIASLTWQAG